MQAATKAALLYALYAPSGTKPASAVEAMPRLAVGDAHLVLDLVELLAAPDSTGRPIGLVRDVSMLSTSRAVAALTRLPRRTSGASRSC